MLFRRTAEIPEPRPWISVYPPSALGDTLLALPTIRALRARYPDHEVHVVAETAAGELLEACGEIDLYRPIPGLAEHRMSLAGDEASFVYFPEPYPETERQVWHRIGKPAHILAFGDETLAYRIHAMGCRFNVLRFGENEDRHISQSLLAQLADMPDYPFDPAAVAPLWRTLRMIRPTTFLHPGASQPWKAWGDMSGLADAIRRRGFQPRIIQPPGQKLRSALRASSIPALAERIAGAWGYIGNDTGTTHLAALLGIPTIALFGPTDPNRWRPLGPAVTVLDRCDGRTIGEPACSHVRGDSCLGRIRINDILRALER